MNSEQQRSATYLCAQFIAGEEAVTQDIQPFMRRDGRGGRFGDEMYLTQFCLRGGQAPAGLPALDGRRRAHRRPAPVRRVQQPLHRSSSTEELPASLFALETDPSPANQIRASVTYNHVIEGCLALTGYYGWQKVCTERGILPGMQKVIKHIGDDERRHMAWGTFTCRRHVAADDANWDVVTPRMGELMPLALGMINWVNQQFDVQPFGLDTQEFIAYAADRASAASPRSNPPAGAPSRRSTSTTPPPTSKTASGQRTRWSCRRPRDASQGHPQ